jgi:hypothetical protein
VLELALAITLSFGLLWLWRAFRRLILSMAIASVDVGLLFANAAQSLLRRSQSPRGFNPSNLEFRSK